jgi:hypothetical protein
LGLALAVAPVVVAVDPSTPAVASPTFAASPPDVRILQTASSIEVLAVATYL